MNEAGRGSISRQARGCAGSCKAPYKPNRTLLGASAYILLDGPLNLRECVMAHVMVDFKAPQQCEEKGRDDDSV